MSNHLPTRTCLVVSTFLLIGPLALAQATPSAAKKNATPTPTATSRDSATGMAGGRQPDQFPKASGARVDQFGRASGRQAAENVPPTPTTDINPADARSGGSAHAIEAVTKKHSAGVKDRDLTVARANDVQDGQPSEKSIEEKGLSNRPVPSAQPRQ
jgi:hypothetical protein